jgi:hypothetical protein
MDLIAPRFGHIVDLRSAVSPLIYGIGERIHSDLGDGIHSQHQIGRKAAVQVGEWIVALEAVHDIAIRHRRQSIEADVSITVRASHEVVAASGGVDERTRGKLKRVGKISTRIGQVFKSLGAHGRRCIGVGGIDQGRLAGHHNGLLRGSHRELKIGGLVLPQTRRQGIDLLWRETIRFYLDRVVSGP